MPVSESGAGWFASLPKEVQDQFVASLSDEDLEAWETDWPYWARDKQLPPPGDWRTWLLLAGRGFGKTRSGAEAVRAAVAAGRKRIALVAPTAADVRDVMVEGESGILSIGLPSERPRYEPSKRRLTWSDGAVATTYSADEPERLRGPQHDFAWCDEIASWRYPEAWDMLMFGLRLGDDPRVIVTTTPKPIKVTANYSLTRRQLSPAGRATRTARTSQARSSLRSFANTRAPASAARSSMPRSSTMCQARCGPAR